uniref:Uncharacterized protein n=2 Tax=Tetranychus urticae TaxID=32264 RepID=T1KGT2_TETUR
MSKTSPTKQSNAKDVSAINEPSDINDSSKTGNFKGKSSKCNKRFNLLKHLLKIKNHPLTRLNVIACILSAVGLIWQIFQVSTVYFSYQTRVDIIISTPQALVIPGFTVCLDIVPNWTIIKQYVPNIEPSSPILTSTLTNLPINVLASMATVNVSLSCRTSVPPNLSPHVSDLCESFSEPKWTVHSSARYDLVKKCVTYFYNADPSHSIRMLDFDARDFFTLRVYSEGNHSVTVFVHNPREILPFEESDSFPFFTKQAARLVVTTSKVITSLLPAPYRTNCVSYNETEYGRTGCIYSCRLKEAQRNCPRWPYNVPAPTNTTVPFRIRGRDCAGPLRYTCSDRSVCPNQCNNVWYSTSLTYLRDKKDPNDYITRFSVRRPLGIEFEYMYGPRLDAIEFLCYVASALSMWMGISVFDLTLLTITWTKKRVPAKTRKIEGVVVLGS